LLLYHDECLYVNFEDLTPFLPFFFSLLFFILEKSGYFFIIDYFRLNLVLQGRIQVSA